MMLVRNKNLVYKIVWGVELLPSNFRRKIQSWKQSSRVHIKTERNGDYRIFFISGIKLILIPADKEESSELKEIR